MVITNRLEAADRCALLSPDWTSTGSLSCNRRPCFAGSCKWHTWSCLPPHPALWMSSADACNAAHKSNCKHLGSLGLAVSLTKKVLLTLLHMPRVVHAHCALERIETRNLGLVVVGQCADAMLHAVCQAKAASLPLPRQASEVLIMASGAFVLGAAP